MVHAHHEHHHPPRTWDRAFRWGVGLNVLFVAVEVVAGLWVDSLALLADAGHNLGDVLGLLLAWGATVLARRSPTPRRTYGYSRATILASLTSGLLLVGAVGAIAWEAVGRFGEPVHLGGGTMILVASVGVVINTVTALFFHKGGESDLNIRGAYLHMAADAAVSLGVVLAGVGVMLSGWMWLDPAISLVIAAVIMASTWGLLRESLDLAVDAVPEGVDPGEVRAFLEALPGVREVHDLHIWGISTTDTVLTAHVVMHETPDDDTFLVDLSQRLKHNFHIGHTTVQLEVGEAGDLCELQAGCG